MDVRPIRKDNSLQSVSVTDRDYDSKRTADFVKLAREKHPSLVVLFNDEKLVGSGWTKSAPGHGNHLHLRFS